MKRLLLRTAVRIERALDRALSRPRGARERRALIEPYLGYSTPTELVARGRLLTNLRRHDPREGQRIWTNVRQMLSLFQTDEVAGVKVSGGGVTAVSDEEGYFTLMVPRAGQSGWVEIAAAVDGRQALLPVQVTPAGASWGVISDIDDTVIHTGAWHIGRNLWTSLTGNAATREVFDDAVELLSLLSSEGANPVFYVSSSPWNLHGFIEDVSSRAGLVRGPRFLRDLGLDEAHGKSMALTGGHHGHKGGAIDRIVAANPGLPFVLIGDTGQEDASIYAKAAGRHPGRIVRVVLRVAGRDAATDDVAALRRAGIAVDVVTDYREVTARLAGSGVLPRA